MVLALESLEFLGLVAIGLGLEDLALHCKEGGVSLDALRDWVGMVLAIGRGDWAAYRELVSPYGLDDRQRPLVNQLAALAENHTPKGDLEGFAQHMAGRGEE
jgi:hypothetical protein